MHWFTKIQQNTLAMNGIFPYLQGWSNGGWARICSGMVSSGWELTATLIHELYHHYIVSIHINSYQFISIISSYTGNFCLKIDASSTCMPPKCLCPHLHSQHHQLPKDAAKGQTSDEIEIPHVATAVSGHVSGVVLPLQAYGKVGKMSEVFGQVI